MTQQNKDYYVCIAKKYCLQLDYDESIMENTPFWRARLESGIFVMHTEVAPKNELPHSAWERFALYMKESGDRIVRVVLCFRNHIINPFPDYRPGYFFSKKLAGFLFVGDSDQVTRHMYCLGYVNENNDVICKNYLLPELVQWGQEVRRLSDVKKSQIVWNKC